MQHGANHTDEITLQATGHFSSSYKAIWRQTHFCQRMMTEDWAMTQQWLSNDSAITQQWRRMSRELCPDGVWRWFPRVCASMLVDRLLRSQKEKLLGTLLFIRSIPEAIAKGNDLLPLLGREMASGVKHWAPFVWIFPRKWLSGRKTRSSLRHGDGASRNLSVLGVICPRCIAENDRLWSWPPNSLGKYSSKSPAGLRVVLFPRLRKGS